MCLFFFFNDTATTEIYTLSLHDALPIFGMAPATPLRERPEVAGRVAAGRFPGSVAQSRPPCVVAWWWGREDRKSTRLNSSHANISYAVFCLKKKKHHITFRLALIHVIDA